MFLFILRFLLLLIAVFSVSQALAEPSIGEFATQLMEPVSILYKFISTASIMLGILCIIAALLRYMQYRVNPLMSPLGSVIVLFILGPALLGLPFLHVIFGLQPFPN